MSWKLPEPLDKEVEAALEDWRKDGKVRRLWAGDASLWTETDEAKWLGWLGIVDQQRHAVAHLQDFADDVRRGGFTDLLLLGMGGSSLGPEVLGETFGAAARLPEVACARLDRSGADPHCRKPHRPVAHAVHRLEQIGQHARAEHLQAILLRAREGGGRRGRGGNAFRRHHRSRLVARKDARGPRASATSSTACRASAGATRCCRISAWCRRRRSASTPPPSSRRAAEMVRSCAPSAPPAENPGVILGAILGVCQRHGHDKVTIVAAPGIADFGAWLEQLLAESTGKLGKGIVPVDAEPLGAPAAYGADRLFVYLRLADDEDGRAGAGGGGARSGRAPGRADHGRSTVAARTGVLPLGDGDRGCRLDHRHQPVRPARCRGEQGQDARADRGL